jgi:hypothetical protein
LRLARADAGNARPRPRGRRGSRRAGTAAES